MSGLFWWSPPIALTGLPRTAPPCSSIAMRAASSEPGPLWSAKFPAMSLSTPIVIADGWDCACDIALVQASVQLAKMTERILMHSSTAREDDHLYANDWPRPVNAAVVFGCMHRHECYSVLRALSESS